MSFSSVRVKFFIYEIIKKNWSSKPTPRIGETNKIQMIFKNK